MKIAILSQSYPPMISGAALFAEKLAADISARGNEVLVLTASEHGYPYNSNSPNLVVERFRSYRNPFRIGQRFALWPHRQIIKCLAEFVPDVIHLHDPLQFAISSLSFSRPRKIPVILTIHQLPWFVGASLPVGTGIQKMVESGLWHYARWVLKRCSSSVVATQTIAEVVFTHTGIHPQVISCGVNLNTFSPACSGFIQAAHLRARWGIPEDVPIILHVGRLDRDKQVEKVVRAASLTLQQTQAHLLIVGDGTERAYLERLCTRLGISERSHFPGFVSVKEGLTALYQISSVFVTASEIETQGLVLLEAAACALPIVAVRATSLHEIVHDGKNGFLVRSGDHIGMAERISELIQDPARAHEMGQTGRLIVESHAAERTFAAYESLYRAAIPSLPSSSRLLPPGRLQSYHKHP